MILRYDVTQIQIFPSIKLQGVSQVVIIILMLQVVTKFMCKYCGKQFLVREEMDQHALIHEDEKPPLTCGVCCKSYTTRSKLMRHVRVHSGERPFPCSVCGKRFPRSVHGFISVSICTLFFSAFKSGIQYSLPITTTQNQNANKIRSLFGMMNE